MHRALLIFLLALSSLAHATGPGPDPFASIRTRLATECAAGTFSGVVLVRIESRDAFTHACGQADRVNDVPVTLTTRFKIYSISKFITALSVMRLVEEGVMALDAPITDYVAVAPEAWRVVTVEHLLRHTSGIPDLSEELTRHFHSDHPAAMRTLMTGLGPENAKPRTTPGAQFAYSNFNYELLADAAAQASGMPFAELVSSRVFQPAGMKDSSLEAANTIAGHPVPVHEPGLAEGYNGEPGKLEQAFNWSFIQQGAGAVRTTAADFAALDRALAEGRVVSPATLEKMMGGPGVAKGYQLGIVARSQDGLRMFGHDGGNNGYISNYQRFPDQQAMLISLSNLGFSDTWWLNTEVAKILKAGRPNGNQ